MPSQHAVTCPIRGANLVDGRQVDTLAGRGSQVSDGKALDWVEKDSDDV
jgi:hypothetical protein